VEYFTEQLRQNPASLSQYQVRSEVLYFNKQLLSDDVTRYFNVMTGPVGLIRGWYIERELYELCSKGEANLRSRMQARPEIGIVKTEESPDFKTAPDYPIRLQLLDKIPGDRYAEVYLRAMQPSERARA